MRIFEVLPKDPPVFLASDERRRVAVSFEGEVSRTKQQFAQEVDINRIVDKWRRGQQPDPPSSRLAYGDFSNVTDFHSALLAIQDADEAFDRLPAGVRERFANNPGELLSFVSDDENLEEAYEIGLLERPPQAFVPAAPAASAAPPETGDGGSDQTAS